MKEHTVMENLALVVPAATVKPTARLQSRFDRARAAPIHSTVPERVPAIFGELQS
jgi:hypothetical protein